MSNKINNKIIFQKQIKVYDNYIDVNYQCTENYVLRDYFTGVKSKLRTWVIASEESLLRCEHLKFYFNDNISSVSSRDKLIPKYSTLDDYLNNFKFCAIQFIDSNGNSITGNTEVTDFDNVTFDLPTNAIMVEFVKHKIANSVVFNITLQDNAYVGNYISNLVGTGGAEQKGVRYVDEDGEIESAIIYFYNNFIPDGMAPGQPGGPEANYAAKPLVSIGTIPGEPAYNTPQNLVGTDMVAKIPIKLYKDNKEILQISIQFELNDEADDIFLGKK